MGEKPHLTAHTDGAAKGNPGPAGFGYTIEQDGVLLEEYGEYIGETTNNIAEYRALAAVLTRMKQLGAGKVTVYSDSELAVKQIAGEYRVKNEGLKLLYAEVMNLLAGFSAYHIVHIPREQNAHADRLANRAIREHRGRKPASGNQE